MNSTFTSALLLIVLGFIMSSPGGLGHKKSPKYDPEKVRQNIERLKQEQQIKEHKNPTQKKYTKHL